MLKRPEGVCSDEACPELGVSKSTYRGMVRDFRELFSVHTKTDPNDRRRARHFIRAQDQP
jgi:hypothetical protein